MTSGRARANLIGLWLVLAVLSSAVYVRKPLHATEPFADAPARAELQQDEFVGPFPSWTNLKTVYRARGDGAADDTAAIQQALDELGKDGRSPVLFIPRGNYRVSGTLSLKFNINLSVVGEDPTTTALLWAGDTGGTMLSVNGIAYSRISRLTFNGVRKAGVAVDQSWDNSQSHFDTGNEYSDTHFVDADYGIRGGFKGHGFAETTVRRARFVRNAKAGITLGNFNALDLWVWDSSFEDCGTGVTNTAGAGNFHVYDSLFRRSAVSDMSMGNTGGFSARGNFSVRSKAFFTGGFTANPATIHLQGNTVIDPIDTTAIKFGNQGPGVISDNVIRSVAGASGPVIAWQSFLSADLTSIGNTFTVPNPVMSNGRLTSVDDRIVVRTTLNPTVPKTPAPWPNQLRRIFEVRPGSDGAAIQRVIDNAARAAGQRPVVHFANGVYVVSETVKVPAIDVQIVGDGYGTILRWAGQGSGPVLRFLGPGRATLREIQVDGANRADAVVFEDVDQKGSRVYLEQAQLRAAKKTSLLVDGLENTIVQIENIGFAYSPEAVSIEVKGAARSALTNLPGRMNVFSGASAGNRISFDVSGGAQVLVRDLWYEGGAGPGFARIHDAATFTLDGARIASPKNGTAAIAIGNLSGRVAVLSTHLNDRIHLSGDGVQAALLALGVFAESPASDYFVDTTSPRASGRLINSRHLAELPGVRSVETANVGASDGSFIRSMLAHTRGQKPAPLTALPSGVTDIRVFRVWVANGLNNITLRP